jgi:hypothetical protein
VRVPVSVGAGNRAGAGRGHRPLAHHPEGGIHRVDIEIADVIAPHGNIIHPDQLLEAALQVGSLRWIGGAVRHSYRGQLHDLSHAPGMDLFYDLDVYGIGGNLVVDKEAQPFFPGEFCRRGDLQTPGRIRRHRLCHVNVAARIDCRRGLIRHEGRNVLEDNNLGATVDQLLVARESGEASRLINAQRVAGSVRDRLEIIRHGPKIKAAVFLEKTANQAAAPAAAHQAGFDLSLRACRRRGLPECGFSQN